MSRTHLFSVTKKDLRIDTFRAGGNGGQHQNKSDTGVRITHHESGAVGEARDSRSQPQNKSAAFRRMIDSPKFQLWLNKKMSLTMLEKGEEERLRKETERWLDIQLLSQNLKVEIGDGINWKEYVE